MNGHHDRATRVLYGCMSGTSADGIDVAAVRISGHGWSMRAEFLGGCSLAYDDAAPGLSARVRAALRQTPMPAGDFAQLGHALALAHVRALRSLAQVAPAAHAISMHGQTLFHKPPVSWQLCVPWPVVQAFGVPVLHDLRGADLAAGGQGAPLTPTSDFVMYSGSTTTAVVNLGGFANATLLPPRGAGPDGVAGWDVCLCNQLLDELARTRLRSECDWDGAAAARGCADAQAVESLRAMLSAQSRSGRSLGTADEVVSHAAALTKHLPSDDACATAAAAIGRTIGNRLAHAEARSLVLAGGGAKHQPLVAAIRQALPLATRSDEGRWPPAYREAAAMAVLGALAQDGIPPGLPQVTHTAATRGSCCVARYASP